MLTTSKFIWLLILVFLRMFNVHFLSSPGLWQTYSIGWLKTNLSWIKTRLIFLLLLLLRLITIWKSLLTSVSFLTTQVFPSKSIRNLSVVFDDQICMSDHVTQLCKSINWLIRNINRIRPYIDDTCYNLVRALVLSRLDYCNVFLIGISKKDLKRLQKLQNKCARLVCLKPKFEHVSPLLNQLQ